jgi:AcrR family transcriptional regulator
MQSAALTAPLDGAEAPSHTATDEVAEKSQPRTRLEVDARRAQLLKLGRELFTSRSYDDLSIEEIARIGGISKGLLYHYFPSKRVFYVESVREAAGELLQQSAPSEDLTPLERLRAGIDAYLDYVENHKSVFATLMWRGIAHDPEVGGIVQSTKLLFFDRLFTEVSNSPIGRNALRGWVAFIEASVLDWIEHNDVSQHELAELFVAIFQQILERPVAAH